MATPILVEQSRAIPVSVRDAFHGTLPVSLPTIFRRRYALLPPIKEVRGQVGTWGQVGQMRTVVTSDGGTMREVLKDVDAPHSFSYQLSAITGPMRPLVDSIDGRWEFIPKGTGTLITWRWALHPRGVGVPLMPLVGKMWLGYAGNRWSSSRNCFLPPSPPVARRREGRTPWAKRITTEATPHRPVYRGARLVVPVRRPRFVGRVRSDG